MRAWRDAARTAFAGRVLLFSMKEAMLCAPLHVPDKKLFRDSMIAATALSHGFTVDVRNGIVARLGRARGVQTPISDVLVPLLAAASDGPG